METRAWIFNARILSIDKILWATSRNEQEASNLALNSKAISLGSAAYAAVRNSIRWGKGSAVIVDAPDFRFGLNAKGDSEDLKSQPT